MLTGQLVVTSSNWETRIMCHWVHKVSSSPIDENKIDRIVELRSLFYEYSKGFLKKDAIIDCIEMKLCQWYHYCIVMEVRCNWEPHFKKIPSWPQGETTLRWWHSYNLNERASINVSKDKTNEIRFNVLNRLTAANEPHVFHIHREFFYNTFV